MMFETFIEQRMKRLQEWSDTHHRPITEETIDEALADIFAIEKREEEERRKSLRVRCSSINEYADIIPHLYYNMCAYIGMFKEDKL